MCLNIATLATMDKFFLFFFLFFRNTLRTLNMVLLMLILQSSSIDITFYPQIDTLSVIHPIAFTEKARTPFISNHWSFTKNLDNPKCICSQSITFSQKSYGLRETILRMRKKTYLMTTSLALLSNIWISVRKLTMILISSWSCLPPTNLIFKLHLL